MSLHHKDGAYLAQFIRKQQTVLTVGLDTDVLKLPACVNGSVLVFNNAIIEATKDLCVAYKLNFAFYESMGRLGWDLLEKTIQLIPSTHLIIADAKRGDIGNTSEMYARAVYDHFGCDAITVSPYMGRDSVKPFYREGKWVIILALTSNEGSADFQQKELVGGKKVYEEVMETTSLWGTSDNTMYVIGATHPSELKKIREKYPDHFFLVPGVGAQGGDVEAICEAGMNVNGGILLNASRSIIYAGTGKDFAEKAREEAKRLNELIKPELLKWMSFSKLTLKDFFEINSFNLNQSGNDWVLEASQALLLLKYFAKRNIPILGGDIIKITNNTIIATGDTWHSDPKKGETLDQFCQRSYQDSVKAVNFFYNLNPKEYKFVLVPRLDLEDYAKLEIEYGELSR
jgi:orotidine-5'-phosphate decarboxylase